MFLRGLDPLFTIREGTCDDAFESCIPEFKRWAAFLSAQLAQIRDKLVHPSHNRHAARTVKGKLIKGQAGNTRSYRYYFVQPCWFAPLAQVVPLGPWATPFPFLVWALPPLPV
jgi:hypothetical protein